VNNYENIEVLSCEAYLGSTILEYDYLVEHIIHKIIPCLWLKLWYGIHDKLWKLWNGTEPLPQTIFLKPSCVHLWIQS